jgi:hypothetical protein
MQKEFNFPVEEEDFFPNVWKDLWDGAHKNYYAIQIVVGKDIPNPI